ncbi:MAG TPA: electron transfer flavoprotein subunit beta/FixA family protein, partial [Gemmatimonadales bacterium]|nr:electron transfer flavoprotein subunit beta/FixA family protein [Gemmatimonadales bacterium]
MKVAVCIKRVPDMEMRFSIAADHKSLDSGGLKYEIGDFDGYALEVGLQLVEKHGGEVVVLSVGPDGVQETLRKGLAMGAARAVQLKADVVPFDGLTIAQALAAELKDGGYDLILFGRMATDSANGTVGPMTAELLDLPCVTSISHLEIAEGQGTARRELEGSAETMKFPLPAVLT